MTTDNGAAYDPITALAAREIYTLINKNAPYPPSDEPLDHYGSYAGAIRDFRVIHRQAQEMMLRGEIVDPWYDSALLWDGYRQEEGLGADYRELDELVRKIGGLPAEKVKKVQCIVDWKRQGVTLADLQHKVFAPEKWIIENILPEGACLFAAKYKSKKSWMALAISLAIAMGGRAMGRLLVAPGRVLYLDLEGKQQRIQKRTRAMLGVQQVDWPANFHIFTKWPQGDESVKELEGWFASYPDTALVVTDVLASFRRPMAKHEEVYRYDRDTIDPLNELAERYHAANLLVHHFNKGKHDDIMDSITGSTGIPSAVNTMWGLTRDVNDSSITILHLRGRDLEVDDPLALRWDTYLNQHVIEGNASDVATTAERKAILSVLNDDQQHTPKEIATALGKPVTAVQFLLRRLLNEGIIDKVGYGKYAMIPQTPQTPQSTQSTQSTQTFIPDSEGDLPTLSGTFIPPQSYADLPKAVNGHSEYSEGYIKGAEIFDSVPGTWLTVLRLCLRSNKEVDQDRAQELCKQFSVDYTTARAFAERHWQ